MAAKSRKRNERKSIELDDIDKEWILWQPCVGVPGLCPPMAKWSDMTDGTYNLTEVWKMNKVLEKVSKWHQQ